MQGISPNSTVALPRSLRPTRTTSSGGYQAVPRHGQSAAGQSGKISPVYARLYAACVVLTVAYYASFNSGNVPPPILARAVSVFCLGSAPMYFFLRNARRYQVPCFEAHALFYAVCFGFAGFHPPTSLPETMTVGWQDVSDALSITLWGMLALGAGYYLPTKIIRKDVPAIRVLPVADANSLIPLAVSCCVVSLGLELIGYFLHTNLLVQVPGIVFSFGFLTLFVLAYERRVGPVFRMLFLFIVAPVTMIARSGLLNGQLAGSAVMLLWLCIVTIRVKRRVPVVLLSVAVLAMLVLQPVKFYVRNLVWTEEMRLSPLQVAEAYVEGFKEVYGSPLALFTTRPEVFQTSFDRVNHLITTAAIIHDTPSKQPFIHGSTYIPLFSKWIPRFLWHDKPEEHIGNEWASRYGFLSERDETTSYNLPWLPEMYMNFGWKGVVGIMFLLGLLFRVFWRVLMQNAVSAADCAAAIVFTQSLVFAESNLSLMMGAPIIFALVLVCLRLFVSATRPTK